MLQTILPVAAVESVSDGLVKLGVHLVVRIKQVELHTADINTPHIGMYLIVCIGNVNDQRVAVLVELTLNGQAAEVLSLVVGNLLTIHRQALCEVAETIEETNGTHIHVRVGSLLHIVTSQHTKAARVDLQGRVDAILHAEVGNRRTLRVGLHINIVTEQLVDVFDTLHQRLVLQDFFLAGKRQTLKQHHGVVLHVVIEFRIKVAEQIASLVVPYPPHVVGNLVQTLQLLGKVRLDNQFLPLGSIRVISFNFHNRSM